MDKQEDEIYCSECAKPIKKKDIENYELYNNRF